MGKTSIQKLKGGIRGYSSSFKREGNAPSGSILEIPNFGESRGGKRGRGQEVQSKGRETRSLRIGDDLVTEKKKTN